MKQKRNIYSFLLILGFVFLLFVADIQAFSIPMIPAYILMSAFLSFMVMVPRKLIARRFDMSVSYNFWYMGLLISIIITLGASLSGFSALFPVLGSLEYARNRRTLSGVKAQETSNKEKTYVSLLVSLIFIGTGLLLIFEGGMYSQELFYQSGAFLLFLSFVSILPYHKLEGLYLFYHNVFMYGIIAAVMLLIFVLSFISLMISVYLFAALAVLVFVSKSARII
ncbi:MAG: hypothetical protein QW292_13115 [Candidatus Parvarchaeota archaeon]